jgi:hypothetical protein
MKPAVVILALVLAALQFAVADDFKTIDRKEYKNVTVSRVEPDGIVLKSKSGISKVYFVELPKEVQERFHYDPAKAAQSRAAEAPKQQQPSATPATGTPSNVFTAKIAGIRAEHEQKIKAAVATGEPDLHRIGAICNDGSESSAIGRDACSRHSGVRCWKYSDGTCH